MNTFRKTVAIIDAIKPYTLEGRGFIAIEVSNVTDKVTGAVIMNTETFSVPIDRFERRLQYHWNKSLVQTLVDGKIIYDRSTPIKQDELFARYPGAPEDSFLKAERDMIVHNVTNIVASAENRSAFDKLIPMFDENFGVNVAAEAEEEAGYSDPANAEPVADAKSVTAKAKAPIPTTAQ